MRGATSVRPRPAPFRDISIHAPREGCDAGRSQRHPIGEISIHAPREGCDFGFPGVPSFKVMISIHAPREGCDGNMVKYCYRWQSFQSTHPVRGATRDHNRHERSRMISIHAPREGCDSHGGHSPDRQTISIHAPREGCDAFRELDKGVKDISIHAPREGCDPRFYFAKKRYIYFNPRTP